MTIRTDISNRLREGRQLLRAEYRLEDAGKLGILRAGNSGIMSEDGNIAGACQRRTHLRQLGISIEEPTDNLLIMFQLGIISEDSIFGDLRKTAAPGEILLREHEIPISWMTSNGTKVTGRPDGVICTSDGIDSSVKPLLGIELKSVASVFVTKQVLLEREPKADNLIQSGHYMWKLGVPFRLIYKQYGLQAMPDYAHMWMPRQGKPGSEYLDYNAKGLPHVIRPYEIVYELQYSTSGKSKGMLQYRVEGENTWTTTVIAAEDINRYYEFVSTMESKKELGPRPLNIKPDGEEKSYAICKYCPLKDICKQVDGRKKNPIGYDQWLSEVREFSANSSSSISPAVE